MKRVIFIINSFFIIYIKHFLNIPYIKRANVTWNLMYKIKSPNGLNNLYWQILDYDDFS